MAYTKEPQIDCHLSELFLTFQGFEALLSLRKFVRMVGPLIDELVPDLDAEMQRQHRQRLDEVAAERAARARRNGVVTPEQRFKSTVDPGPAPDHRARQNRARNAPDEVIIEVGRALGYELITEEIARIRKRAGTVSLAEERRVNAEMELGAKMSRMDEVAFELLARSGVVADQGLGGDGELSL